MSKKIAVIAANGHYGRPIVKEAIKRGNDVTVFVINDNTTVASQVVKKDPMSITKEDLAGFDVVIDANGIWADQLLNTHYQQVMHVCDCLSGTETKFMIVGGEANWQGDPTAAQYFGEGTEHVHEEYSTKAILTRWFGSASAYRDAAADAAQVGFGGSNLTENAHSMEDVFAGLRTRKDVNWIYMSPSCSFKIEGMDVKPYDDYAEDLVDEAESGIHYQQRIGVTCE
jgi:uncharacterized protein